MGIMNEMDIDICNGAIPMEFKFNDLPTNFCKCIAEAFQKNPSVTFSLNYLIGSTMKWIYIQHPYHNPSGMSSFINKIKADFIIRSDVERVSTNFYVTTKLYKDLYMWLSDWFEKYEEFTDLNLSNKELLNAGKLQCDLELFNEDDRFYDFIDLEALINNIVWDLYISSIF